VIQAELLGTEGTTKRGMLPKWAILGVSFRRGGVADLIHVRHSSGGTSTIGLKSFEMGRESFQGTRKDFIWLDEECPRDVMGECQMRLMATRPSEAPGLLLCSFTPLLGLSSSVLYFLPGGRFPSQYEQCQRIVERFDECGNTAQRAFARRLEGWMNE